MYGTKPLIRMNMCYQCHAMLPVNNVVVGVPWFCSVACKQKYEAKKK